MTFFKNLLNLILPPRCAVCGEILEADKGLCDKCIGQINFINGVICSRCGQPLEIEAIEGRKPLCGRCQKAGNLLFRLSRSACLYDDSVKKLIHDFKFHDHTDLAPLLAKMMYVAGADIFKAGVDIIVPVPLYYTRLIKRRYNQSALLAKELGKLTNVAVSYQDVIKIRKTKPQTECSASERLKNVKGAFALKNPEQIKGKRVLLIDDVLTTGTTLKECAFAIKKAKPKSVDCLTIARVI